MENVIACSSCKTRLKVPATVAAGKKIKCPKCSQLITVPGAAAAVPVNAAVESGEYAIQDKPIGYQAPAPSTKPCPFCGEQVLARSGQQGLRTGDPHELRVLFQDRFTHPTIGCVHGTMLSWRYNNFNFILEEP